VEEEIKVINQQKEMILENKRRAMEDKIRKRQNFCEENKALLDMKN
jgi:hypothetical protein